MYAPARTPPGAGDPGVKAEDGGEEWVAHPPLVSRSPQSCPAPRLQGGTDPSGSTEAAPQLSIAHPASSLPEDYLAVLHAGPCRVVLYVIPPPTK